MESSWVPPLRATDGEGAHELDYEEPEYAEGISEGLHGESGEEYVS